MPLIDFQGSPAGAAWRTVLESASLARGGKGSLPHYLLGHKVSPKVMRKMMVLLLLCHWLPSKLEYEQAMLLFWDEFSTYIKKNASKELI